MKMPSFLSRAAKMATGLFTPGKLRDVWGMLSGINPAGRGDPPDLGTQNYLEVYETHPWVHAIVDKIAYACATPRIYLQAVRTSVGKGSHMAIPELQRMPLEYRRKELARLKKQGRVTELTEHPMLTALDSSNPYLTGLDVRMLQQIYIECAGDAFMLKERNAVGVPVGLWPLPPHWVLALPTPQARQYQVQYRAWVGNIPEAEVWWLHKPGPVNPYTRGAGRVRALGDDIEIDLYANKHAKSTLFNRARADFIIQMAGAKPEEIDRAEMRWNQRNQGYWKAGKPYFTNAESLEKIEFAQQNFADLMLVPLKEAEKNVIVQGFGMPPELLGMLQNSNKATVQAAEHLFAKYMVEPRLEWNRSQMQARLVPEYDERILVEYESPVSADDEFELNVMKANPAAFAIDEWRARAGFDPEINAALGKSRVVQMNTYVTPDPLDLDTRPLPTGGTDAEPAKTEAPAPAAAPAVPKRLTVVGGR